jgi:hypothetical protein
MTAPHPRMANRARMRAIADADAVLAASTPNTRQHLAEMLHAAYAEIDELRQRLAEATGDGTPEV